MNEKSFSDAEPPPHAGKVDVWPLYHTARALAFGTLAQLISAGL